MEKILEKIAFTKINDENNTEHNSMLVHLYLKELYAYSKETEKEIEITNDIQGIFKIVEFMFNAMNRNTEIWDALFLIHLSKNNNKTEYTKCHEELYMALYGSKRTKEDIYTIIKLTMKKIGIYLRS